MLKTIDPVELSARVEAAQALYKDRKSGIDLHAAVGANGEPIAKMIDGGVETFFIPNAFEVLPTYLQAIDNGCTLHPLSLVQVGTGRYGETQFDLYMYKPDDVINAALIKIAEDETASYLAEIEAENEAFIQQAVADQLRVDLAREERERAAAEAERRAAVEKQIRETFKPTEVVEAPVTPRGKK